MNEYSHTSLFREQALEYYAQRQEKAILPHLAGRRKKTGKNFYISTGKHGRQRRVTFRLQMSAIECGAACLEMILAYYRRQTSIREIREQCGIRRDGLSAFCMVRA